MQLRLSPRTISRLAEMICGASGGGYGYEWSSFPYRSSSHLTQFFRDCGLDYVHDGSTRKYWVEQVLDELNQGVASIPQLPSGQIIRVIQELMDPLEFDGSELNREKALLDLNKVLARDGMEAYLDATGKCYVRNVDSSISSTTLRTQPRPLSAEELARRKEIEEFLEQALEDEVIERFLVPLFRQLGFSRVIPTGHRDRSLEFGKDIWMKYRLPTGHFIYFSAQVKREKIDAAGRELTRNISGILAQARMALEHPIFDPETNRKHLVDHVFIISASFITKQARMLLIEHLDKEARRHIIFMDRDELLDLGAMTAVEVSGEEDSEDEILF